MPLEYNLTDEQYDAMEGVRKSDLDLIALSPLHYKTQRGAKRIDTPAFRFGRLFHCMTLEREKVEERFVVAPDINKRTNAGKAEWENFEGSCLDKGLTWVTQDQWDQALCMMEAVWGNPMFQKLHRNAMFETSFFAGDPETGLIRKARPDLFNPKLMVIADLKSSEGATAWEFGASAYKYRYYVQDPYYSGVVSNVTHEAVQAFVFVVVDKNPPYPVSLFALDEQAVGLGDSHWKRDLATLKHCLETDTWPGFDPKIQALSLPRYAYNGND